MRKIIDYKWLNGGKFGAFVIGNEEYRSIKENCAESLNLQKNQFDDKTEATAWYIYRGFNEKKPFAEVVILTIAFLVRNGFELTPNAQKQFEYWGNRFAEIVEKREKERLAKIQEREEEKKERESQSKLTTVLWCDKLDCEISLSGCQRCNRYQRYGCRPSRQKVIYVGVN